jgi:formiminoglutamate deiminase
MTIFADELLTPSGWVRNARVEIEGGRISAITENAALQPDDERHGIVLPGVPNVHSHAFQRAMAGLAEQPGPGSDNFWSWRDIMYRFALAFEPEDLEAVASQLYVEMLEAGFTRVGEFHYLHHASDGGHYGAIAEMAGRIVAASGETGIGLTLLPVFYAHSNFGGAAPNDGQRRFINSLDSFERLLEGCRTALSGKANSRLGIAPHSLRAVTGDELSALTGMDFSGPVHIHAAEQTKEVEESIAFSGKRPVEWLLDNADFKRQWCFIHATHMTES